MTPYKTLPELNRALHDVASDLKLPISHPSWVLSFGCHSHITSQHNTGTLQGQPTRYAWLRAKQCTSSHHDDIPLSQPTSASPQEPGRCGP